MQKKMNDQRQDQIESGGNKEPEIDLPKDFSQPKGYSEVHENDERCHDYKNYRMRDQG